MAFVEFQMCIIVYFPRILSVFCVWRDKCDQTDLSRVSEELGHLGDPTDILSSRYWGEIKIFAKTLSDYVTVENQDFLTI